MKGKNIQAGAPCKPYNRITAWDVFVVCKKIKKDIPNGENQLKYVFETFFLKTRYEYMKKKMYLRINKASHRPGAAYSHGMSRGENG